MSGKKAYASSSLSSLSRARASKDTQSHRPSAQVQAQALPLLDGRCPSQPHSKHHVPDWPHQSASPDVARQGDDAVPPEYYPHRRRGKAVRWHIGDAHASDEPLSALLLVVLITF